MANLDSDLSVSQSGDASAGAGLLALDQRTVAVHLVSQRCERLVRGIGSLELDSKLGNFLRIDCADISGRFSILIRASEWTGEIKLGSAFGCDYVVNLTVPES